ncbi:MAG: hypothetical protein ACREIA_02815 [Opitutaceae bacterium]
METHGPASAFVGVSKPNIAPEHAGPVGGGYLNVEWLNLHSKVLNSPEVAGSASVDRGIWVSLLGFCSGQENDGIIRACRDWSDRRWQQTVRVTLREVNRQTELWSWNGDDLVVRFYPSEKEREVQAKREAGKRTAHKRWGQQSCSANDKANSSSDGRAYSSAISSASSSADAERNRNRKGKEGELLVLESPAEPANRAEASRNLLFDALAEVDGSDPRSLTKSAAGACGKALSEIRKACPSVSPAEINLRAERYRRRFAGAACTPSAIAKHWAALANEGSVNGGDLKSDYDRRREAARML